MSSASLTFPDAQTAHVRLPRPRLATSLRELCWQRGYEMQCQTANGSLWLRLPGETSHPEIRQIFNNFCQENNLSMDSSV